MIKIAQRLVIVFSIIIFLAILVKVLKIDKKILMIYYPNKYSNFVEKFSEQYEIDKNLIYAIIKNESNFEKTNYSNKGAVGLMQLMEPTAEEMAELLKIENIDLEDAETNIHLGTKYFSVLYNKYNNTELALAAYNAGFGNVDKWISQGTLLDTGENIENIPFKETNMYVRKVMFAKEIYDNLYE